MGGFPSPYTQSVSVRFSGSNRGSFGGIPISKTRMMRESMDVGVGPG